jgi:8-oxo-dGTP pyrophosphatase MutT (NUDIX family)
MNKLHEKKRVSSTSKNSNSRIFELEKHFYEFDKNIICCNCGKKGHIYKKCYQPVTSFGLICFHTNKTMNKDMKLQNELKYEMKNEEKSSEFPELVPGAKDLKFIFIRRKDSLAFSEIARARYRVNDEDYIRKMLEGMTKQELLFLKNVKHSDDIWYRLWTPGKQSKSRCFEYKKAKKKLQTLIDGLVIRKKQISFSSLIKEIEKSGGGWEEPEWGFPKGRRIPKETDLECSLREFQEETDIPSSKFHIIENIAPIEETFIGTNNIKYKHIYYFAHASEEIPLNLNSQNNLQKAEVSAMQWFYTEDLLKKIRKNHSERKKLIIRAANFLSTLLEQKINDKNENENNPEIN